MALEGQTLKTKLHIKSWYRTMKTPMQFENVIIKYRVPAALLNVKNNEATMRSQITWKHCKSEVVICDTA